ncbi:MAG: MATE family efflux transporter [bacterium]|nr:MATE family efflux transporter [bacterium]
MKPNQDKDYNSKAKLVEGPVGKTLVKLTIPMFFGIMSMIAFNLIDTYFVGRLGTTELAAMSFTFPVVYIISSIALGLGTGAAAAISRAIGVGDSHRVRRLTTDGLMLSFVIVLFFIGIGMLTIEPFFRLLGASEETLPFIKQYMTIWYPGMIFLIIPMVGNNAIRATGDAKTPGMIMVFAMLINLVLDPLLIFGIGPFPRWGLEGAAAATVIARASTLIIALRVLYSREKMITLKPPKFSEALKSWKEVLYVGLPAAGTHLIIPISMAVVTRLVSEYGKEAVAGLGVATRVEALALTVFMAISAIIVPFVGQNMGSKKMDRVREAVKLCQKFSLIWCGALFLLFLLIARPLAGMFDDNPIVIDTIVSYLWIISVTYGLQAILMVNGSVFNGLNKPMPAAALSILKMLILYIPLAYIGSDLWQTNGIFGAAAVSNIIAGPVAIFWLSRTLRAKI